MVLEVSEGVLGGDGMGEATASGEGDVGFEFGSETSFDVGLVRSDVEGLRDPEAGVGVCERLRLCLS